MATGAKTGCYDVTEDFLELANDSIAINTNTPNSYSDFHKYSRFCQELLSLWLFHYPFLPYIAGWGFYNFSLPLHAAPRQHLFTSSHVAGSTDITQSGLA